MTCGRFAVMGAVALLWAAPLQAQNRFAIEPYVGAFLADGGGFPGSRLEPAPPSPPLDPLPEFDSTAGILLGVRASWEIRPGWTVEGAYGYSRYDTEVTVHFSTVIDPEGRDETLEVSEHGAHLYYGAIRYDLTRGRVRPFLGAGAGGITVSTDLEGLEALLGVDSVTDPLLSLGGGLVIDVAPRTRIRGDLRDQVQFCSEDSGLCEGDETLHNVEISGGIEITF